jgi:hypothetical protein
MLVIRDAQMEALSMDMAKRFEQSLVAHVRECFPNAAQDLGEPGLAATVAWGVQRALHYGFREELDVTRYINLMFAQGLEFDCDPEFAWSVEILANTDLPATARMDALTERALEITRAPEAGA